MSAAAVDPPSGSRWAVPYRPLRARTLLLQLVVLSVAEIGLFSSYSGHDARFHWATHFLVGLIAALVWLSAYLLIAAKPAPGQLIVVLLFHLFAMTPDLLFRTDIPHYRWMDVFLGHVSAHYLPDGDDSWLALALIALAGYAWLLCRWLAARDQEAVAGLPPGIGIGGVAVIRAQRDPRTTPLVHRHALIDVRDDNSVPVMLLHDLGQSGASWQSTAIGLAKQGVTSIAVDLLGHGSSRTIGTRFAVSDQAAALESLVDKHGWDEVVVVGFGWGAAVAAAFTRGRPELTSRLILIDPPVFNDPAEARQRLGRSWLGRQTLASPGLANFTCGLMCLTRAPLGRLARIGKRGARGAQASARVQHTYPSLRDGFDTLLHANPVPSTLRDPPCPVTVLLTPGAAVSADELRGLPVGADVQVVTVTDADMFPGRHDAVTQLVGELARN